MSQQMCSLNVDQGQMLKIVKIWYNTEYMGEWILQSYPIIYPPPPPPIESDVHIIWHEKGFQLR